MEKITIEKNNSGLRIDKFLTKEFFSNSAITRGEIIRQIKDGNILVNKKKTKPSYILKENDIIIMKHETWNMEQKELIPNSNIKLKIIHEDENIIIVNKPAGLQIHPDAHEKNDTLVNALLTKFPEIKNVGENPMRPGIVHRLDKDTSGIIVIAKNQRTFLELKRKFQEREMEKKYVAIVYGKLTDEGVIKKPLARSTSYRKQVIAGKKTKTKIREAITHYEVLKTGNDFSLLEVAPKTGRMHQIRVHLTSIGHPIVGDKIYSLKNIEKAEAPRQMLHAKSLSFELFGQKYCFEAELPEDFKKIMTAID